MSLVMAGVGHRAQVRGDDVAVTAQAGPVVPRQVQVTWDGTDFAFDAVHTGTEHVVAIVDDVDGVDVPGCGRMVRHLPALARDACSALRVNCTPTWKPSFTAWAIAFTTRTIAAVRAGSLSPPGW